MKTVIGLTGLAGSGKSTVAKYLVKQHDFTLLSFAGPLKKMLRTLDPFMGGSNGGAPIRLSALLSLMSEDGLKQSSFGPEYRRLLQNLGTDCVRAVEPEFWVHAAVAQMVDPNGRYVFDDVRFPNEAETITTLNPNGLWHIHRAGQQNTGSHISEQHAGNMNEPVTIYNDALSALYPQIEYYLSVHV